ncbi:MAG TPA: nucleotide exchange factor GrpE [Pirellulaceae bacterium]|nr:nucleotide exchange factor GrpE [Pirellulaceae bacterium]
MVQERQRAEAAEAQANGAGAESPQETPDATTTRLEQELADANQRVLRVQAELENYRKRVRREMEDERRYAIVPLVKDLLHVVDNLERAIDAAQASPGSQGLLDGVKLVATQLQGVLAQHHCQRIADVGESFDPNLHQAIAQEPSEQIPLGKVTRAAQAGYKLYDRVIRPSQVFVSTGAPGSVET